MSLNVSSTLVSVKNIEHGNKPHINSSYKFIGTSGVDVCIYCNKTSDHSKLKRIGTRRTHNTQHKTYLLLSMSYGTSNLMIPYKGMFGICTLLGFYAVSNGKFHVSEQTTCPVFKGQAVILNCLILEEGTDRFSQNVGTKMLCDAA